MRLERKIIGIFGKVNCGKSTLFNLLTGSDTAIVSPHAGTTTDPVKVNAEIPGLGKSVIIDTAGFSDGTSLGDLRLERTLRVLEKCDLALYLIGSADEDGSGSPVDGTFLKAVQTGNKKVIYISRSTEDSAEMKSLSPFVMHGKEDAGRLYKLIAGALATDVPRPILGDLVKRNDRVCLVIPIDEESPNGRIILPQQIVIRALLDTGALTTIVSPEELRAALSINPDFDLVITDSQAFRYVYDNVGNESRITSFSVLFAGLKGNIELFINSFYKLKDAQNIAILEGCTHHPGDSDIARVQIPHLITETYGAKNITVTRNKWDLPGQDMIIMCGGCTKTAGEVHSIIDFACANNIPITNYGVAIAGLNGILDKIVYP